MVQHKQQLEDVGISFSGGNSPFMFDGDNDKENEEDKIGTAQMRDWQEFHALVLNPLISGQVYIKNSKL